MTEMRSQMKDMVKPHLLTIVLTMLVLGLITFGAISYINKSTVINVYNDANQWNIKDLEEVFVPEPWTISGDTVYINDSKATIIAQPHTGTGWITYNITAKQFTGDIDIIFGFNTNEIKPKAARWKPVVWNDTQSYTCEYEAVWNQSAKTYTCYEQRNIGNGTWNHIHKQGSYEWGNIPSQTAYWNVSKTNWTDISGVFSFREINFEGMNRWYFRNNFPVVAGETYTFQVNLQKQIATAPEYKYWFAIKPSDKTFEEAIATETLYALDPWTEGDLLFNLSSYYKLDANATTQPDAHNNDDFDCEVSVINNQAGFFNTAVNFTGADHCSDDDNNMSGNVVGAFSGWVNINALGQDAFIGIGTTGGTTPYGLLGMDSGGQALVQFHSGAQLSALRGSGGDFATTGGYVHFAITHDGINTYYFINSVRITMTLLDGNADAWLHDYALDTFSIGEVDRSSDYGGLDGQLDELAFFTGNLSQSQINELYNSGAGLEFNPSITLQIDFPLNITYNETVTQFNYTITAGVGDRCWNSKDDGVTNSSSVNAGTNFTINSKGLENHWILYCNNSGGGVFNADINFFVNKSVDIIRNAPVDNLFMNETNEVFNWTSSATNTNLTNTTLTIWHDNGTLFLSNFSSLSGNTDITIAKNITNFVEDVYIWNVETCGIDILCSLSTNRTLNIGLTIPDVIINDPSGNLGAVENGTSLVLNWTISEGVKVLSNHINNCNFTYNGVTTVINLSFCVNVTEIPFAYISGVDNITMKVQDNPGNINISSASWVVTLSEINQSFDTPVVEGSLESFEVWVTSSPLFLITAATLQYNGSVKTGTLENPTGNTYKASTNFIIPSQSADVNVTFFWRFVLNDSSQVDSKTSNQSIINVAATDCSPVTNVLYNFTIVDEATQIRIVNDTTGEINFALYSADRSEVILTFNKSYSINPFGVCLNNNLSASELLLDLQLKYFADTYSQEFYNIQNRTINVSTFPSNISLFDLNISTAQIFQIIYKDENFLPVPNALIKVRRKYIDEGIFKDSEIPRTDSFGKALASLVKNDIIYTFIVTSQDVILARFDNFRVDCQTPAITDCVINLNNFRGTIPVTDFEEEIDLSYTLTHNRSSRVISFVFTVPSGTISTYTLNATKNDPTGTSACSDLLISSAGTLSCSVPNSIGNASVNAKVFRNNVLVAQGDVDVSPTPGELYGPVVVILGLFIMITLIGIGMSDNPIFTVVFLLLGVIVLFSLNLVANNGFIGATSTFLWLALAIIILIIKGGKRD